MDALTKSIIDAWRQLILAQNASGFKILCETETDQLADPTSLLEFFISPEYAFPNVDLVSSCSFTFYPGNKCDITLNPMSTDSDLDPDDYPKYRTAVLDAIKIAARSARTDWRTAFKMMRELIRSLCDDLLILPPVLEKEEDFDPEFGGSTTAWNLENTRQLQEGEIDC